MSVASVVRMAVRLTGLILSLLLAIFVLRAVLLFPTPKELPSCASSASHQRIDESTRVGVISRFAEVVRFKTITRGSHLYDADQLTKLHAFLRKCERLFLLMFSLMPNM